jgi:oligoribonuclease (3'-5' exoribonuclease)
MRTAMREPQQLPKLAKPLIWMDLEMTGLDTARDTIIEIACLVSDGALQTVIEVRCSSHLCSCSLPSFTLQAKAARKDASAHETACTVQEAKFH